MIDLILEVPEVSQAAILDDPNFQGVMSALGAFAAQTGILLGTRAVDGKRLVLAQAASDLPAVQEALATSGVPWVIVAAAASRPVLSTDAEGVEVEAEERYWLQAPDLPALMTYAANTIEFDALSGEVISSRRPTVEELASRQWHHWGRPWPAIGVV